VGGRRPAADAPAGLFQRGQDLPALGGREGRRRRRLGHDDRPIGTCRVELALRMTARSITFRSSRMLPARGSAGARSSSPGECARRASRAPGRIAWRKSRRAAECPRRAPERRDNDREDVQAVVEIIPELPVGHQCRKIAIGRGDHTDIDRERLGAADPLQLPVLQDPQELDLHVHRQLGDLVEEDGRAVRQLEAPGLAGQGPV